ncbi:hypothetical protein SynA1840_00464 [Synechococcus sp. A18-40]|nr:hypothetical protein SynA1840_00464 [Synechococcus sp. A18-40]
MNEQEELVKLRALNQKLIMVLKNDPQRKMKAIAEIEALLVLQ